MIGILKRPMITTDALRKYDIFLPERYTERPDEGVKKLFEQGNITLRQMDGYLHETSEGYTIPKLLLEKYKEHACNPFVLGFQRIFM